jgi:hypothetical protein
VEVVLLVVARRWAGAVLSVFFFATSNSLPENFRRAAGSCVPL